MFSIASCASFNLLAKVKTGASTHSRKTLLQVQRLCLAMPLCVQTIDLIHVFYPIWLVVTGT